MTVAGHVPIDDDVCLVGVDPIQDVAGVGDDQARVTPREVRAIQGEQLVGHLADQVH